MAGGWGTGEGTPRVTDEKAGPTAFQGSSRQTGDPPQSGRQVRFVSLIIATHGLLPSALKTRFPSFEDRESVVAR